MKLNALQLKIKILLAISFLFFGAGVFSLLLLPEMITLILMILHFITMFVVFFTLNSFLSELLANHPEDENASHQGVFTDNLVDVLNKKVLDRDAQIERLKDALSQQQKELNSLKQKETLTTDHKEGSR